VDDEIVEVVEDMILGKGTYWLFQGLLSLADLAIGNRTLNGLKAWIFAVKANLNTFRPRRRFDVILSKPPYIPK
jgi:hypothetical protein